MKSMNPEGGNQGPDAVHTAQREAARHQGGTTLDRNDNVSKGMGESLMEETPDEKNQLPSNASDEGVKPGEFDYP